MTSDFSFFFFLFEGEGGGGSSKPIILGSVWHVSLISITSPKDFTETVAYMKASNA